MSNSATLKGVMLLEHEQAVQTVGKDALLSYWKAVETAVAAHVSSLTPGLGENLLLVFHIQPGSAKPSHIDATVSEAGTIPQEFGLALLFQTLFSITAPAVKLHPLNFYMVFKLWGGSETCHHIVASPEEIFSSEISTPNKRNVESDYLPPKVAWSILIGFLLVMVG